MGFFWTKEEDDILKRHYAELGHEGFAKLLPERSPAAIKWRATKMGLHKCGYVTHVTKTVKITQEDFLRLKAQIPHDTRDNTGRLLGDPLYERSSLYRKLEGRNAES